MNARKVITGVLTALIMATGGGAILDNRTPEYVRPPVALTDPDGSREGNFRESARIEPGRITYTNNPTGK